MAKKTVGTLVNINNLTMWSRNESEATATYGEAVSFQKRFMTVSDTPTTVSDQLFGDGEVAADYNAITGGTLELGLTDLSNTDRVLIYGESVKDGTNVITTDTNSGYNVVAYSGKQQNGLLTLVKYLRVKFAPGQEQAQQVTNSGVNWATKTVSGTYSADPETGIFRYIRDNVDPTKDSEIITKWFSDATYYGKAGE